MGPQPYLVNVDSPGNRFVLGFLGPVGCGLEHRLCCNRQHSYAVHFGNLSCHRDGRSSRLASRKTEFPTQRIKLTHYQPAGRLAAVTT